MAFQVGDRVEICDLDVIMSNIGVRNRWMRVGFTGTITTMGRREGRLEIDWDDAHGRGNGGTNRWWVDAASVAPISNVSVDVSEFL